MDALFPETYFWATKALETEDSLSGDLVVDLMKNYVIKYRVENLCAQ